MTTSSLPVNKFILLKPTFFSQDYDNIMILGSIIENDVKYYNDSTGFLFSRYLLFYTFYFVYNL